MFSKRCVSAWMRQIQHFLRHTVNWQISRFATFNDARQLQASDLEPWRYQQPDQLDF